MKQAAGKIAYGLLFCILLPALLLLWAAGAEDSILLSPLKHELTGIVISITGFVIAASGMFGLWKFGKGLPMNAFPPERYVTRGIFRYFRHPIYTGFCLLCLGLSIYFGSAAGLFLVTPVVILSCIALVQGYEAQAMRLHFGDQQHYPLFGLPEKRDVPVAFSQKLFGTLGVFIPWVAGYEALIILGPGENAIHTGLPFENSWSVYEPGEVFYGLTYFFVLFVPFFARTQKQLHDCITMSAWAAGIGLFLQAVLPFCFNAREFVPTGWLGELIIWERSLDGPSAAFPSFHVIWAFVGAACYSIYFPRLRWMFYTIAILISLSCMAIGVHSLADVLSGYMVFVMVLKRNAVWKWMQERSERLANSWSEVRLGKFRIISHSVFAGLAGAAGIFIAGFFIQNDLALLVMMLSTVIGAGLWGQFIDGTPKLLRPFGYFGGLIGGMMGAWACDAFLDVPLMLSFGAIALAAPWVQAIGRLRCLVQGCCHGRLAGGSTGIKYINEHSRVCRVPELIGQPVHNTPLYSIACNVFTGLLLFRLWYAGAALPLLIGLYFIFTGLGRFVEEAYRGEPGTKKWKGLTIYQWLAIGSVCAGAWITTLSPTISMDLQVSSEPLHWALVGFAALLYAFALGMDFPGSRWRFSRLSG